MKDRQQHQHILPQWDDKLALIKKQLRWDARPWYWVLGSVDWIAPGEIKVDPDAVFIAPEPDIWRDQATELKESKWQSLCRQVKHAQSILAPQAVILGCSLDLLSDAKALSALRQDLVQALQVCRRQRWGARPVYVTVSGIESLPGFEAYFARLKPEQKSQLLGFIGVEDLERQCKDLHQQLSARVLSHLQWESGRADHNAAVWFFPQVLADFYPKLIIFLQDIHLLRGVYFTRADGFNKIKQEVLRPEAQHFKPWQTLFDYAESKRKSITWLSVLSIVLLFGLWCLGVLKGEDYLSDVTQNIQVSTLSAEDPTISLPALERLNQLGIEDDHWFIRYFGIMFPNKVKNAIQSQYNLSLRKDFEPFLVGILEQNLQNSVIASKNNHLQGVDLLAQDAILYERLSAYLMLNDLNHFDANTIAMQMNGSNMLSVYWDWVNLGPESMPINLDLVSQARAILGSQPLAIQAFFALKASSHEAPVYLAGEGQNHFAMTKGSSIDGFFTAGAAQKYLTNEESDAVLQTLKQSWVLGADQVVQIDKTAIHEVSAQVTEFYWNQYAAAWNQALSGVTLKNFASTQSAAIWFAAAAKSDSDWMILWQQMSQNLPGLSSYFADAGHLNGIQAAMLAIANGLAQVHGGKDSLELAVQILNGQFAPLNQLEALADQAPQPVQSIVHSMVQAATRTVFDQAARQVSLNWHDHVEQACHEVMQTPQPDLNHFSRFLGQNGLGGQFMNDHVAALVNIQNGTLEARSAYGVPFILPGFLQQNIVRLLLIHHAFFNDGAAPHLSIVLTPMVLSKNLADFTVSYGAQTLFYQNGPRFATVWDWPAENGEVLVKFVGLDGQVQTETYSGVWGLIQFLNSATVTTIDRNHFALTFSLGDFSATYELSLTQGNFAGVIALQGFDCE